MANDCLNVVSFEGDEKQIDKLFTAYEKTLEVRKINRENTVHFILFEDSVITDNYMREIDLESSCDHSVMHFTTNWSPDPVQLIRVAKMFNVSFVLEYEELGCNVYGEFKYDHITDELFDRCANDKECDEAELCDETYEYLDRVVQSKEWNRCSFDLSDGTYDILEDKNKAA